MGLEGAGKLQEASQVLQSGICQELKVPRAPQDLQVQLWGSRWECWCGAALWLLFPLPLEAVSPGKCSQS